MLLMNYLFNPRNQVKESEAILIIVLLLDLQQDFRLAIKQSLLRFLLRYGFVLKLIIIYLLISTLRKPIHTLQQLQQPEEAFSIGNGSMSDRISVANHPWASVVEMQFPDSQQSLGSGANGESSSVASYELPLVRTVSNIHCAYTRDDMPQATTLSCPIADTTVSLCSIHPSVTSTKPRYILIFCPK